MIAQSLTGTPGHVNSMATGVKHFVRRVPARHARAGRRADHERPWKTAGQVNDFTVVTPVFRGWAADRLLRQHLPRARHRRAGSSRARRARCTRRGSRSPCSRSCAPASRTATCSRSSGRTCASPTRRSATSTRRSARTRSAPTACARCSTSSTFPTSRRSPTRSSRAPSARCAPASPRCPTARTRTRPGATATTSRSCCAAPITVAGDEMRVDWTGSSPQSSLGINLVLNYTHAYASYAMKAAVAPEVPHNDGAFRPVHVTAPLGSILNCEHPAPVASRHVIGHFLPGIIFGALAPAMSGRLLAGSADALWITVWQGRDRAARPFVQTVFQLGGMGARTDEGRPQRDRVPLRRRGHARRGRRVAEPARLPPARAAPRLGRRGPLPRRSRPGSRDHVLDRRSLVGVGAARPHAASGAGSRGRARGRCGRVPAASGATTCRSSASSRSIRPMRSSCACPAVAATARPSRAIPRPSSPTWSRATSRSSEARDLLRGRRSATSGATTRSYGRARATSSISTRPRALRHDTSNLRHVSNLTRAVGSLVRGSTRRSTT